MPTNSRHKTETSTSYSSTKHTTNVYNVFMIDIERPDFLILQNRICTRIRSSAPDTRCQSFFRPHFQSFANPLAPPSQPTAHTLTGVSSPRISHTCILAVQNNSKSIDKITYLWTIRMKRYPPHKFSGYGAQHSIRVYRVFCSIYTKGNITHFEEADY